MNNNFFTLNSFTRLALLKSILIVSALVLTACSGGGGGDGTVVESETLNNQTAVIDEDEQQVVTELDLQLQALIVQQDISANPVENRNLPSIEDPLAQLGKLLFFSKSLGGGFDSACVSCHHPVFGGADQLSLPVGVGAIDEDLLGRGREHVLGLPLVPRNSPTVFNVGLQDSGLFWDSRVESLGKEQNANGQFSAIRTPDSDFGMADTNAAENLVATQAGFPVTSVEEMKTDAFEPSSDNSVIRNHLAARIGNYGVGEGELASTTWVAEFQQAFNSSAVAEDLVTFDNIALAIGEYERSMVFINNPWKLYVEGDVSALTEQQKAGAVLFFTSVDEDGAGCNSCHSGDTFSDAQHHVVAFPQIGPGKGDGALDANANSDDFARERETQDINDRYRFRTPGLLNIAVTAPYGHTGAYASLEQVLRHYVNPQGQVDDYFSDSGWCQLTQFASMEDCENLYPGAEQKSRLALQQLNRNRNRGESNFQSPRLNAQEMAEIVSFLESLTDPCITDRECLSPWIPDAILPGPDGQQLNARNIEGDLL